MFLPQPLEAQGSGQVRARNFGDLTQCWTDEATTTLTSLADGADLLFAGLGFEQFPANVAEYYDIPLAMLHWFPMRVNGHVLPFLPAPLGRKAMTAYERMSWGGAVKEAEDAQRRELGLPKATCPWPRRIAERGSLEIQAYDKLFFPGLAAEWAKWDGQRPFVGTLTLGLATDADEEVASWIAAGTPPICFGFGSIPVGSAGRHARHDRRGLRAVRRAGVGCAPAGATSAMSPSSSTSRWSSAVNYATIFPTLPRGRASRRRGHHGHGPACRSPQVVLWTFFDQPLVGAAVKRLKVGTARRLSTTTEKSLVADLRRILAPAIPHPGPRARHPDDQTRRKCHCRR